MRILRKCDYKSEDSSILRHISSIENDDVVLSVVLSDCFLCVPPLDISIRGKGGVGHGRGSRLHVVVEQGGLLHHGLCVFAACAKRYWY
jgi:hypothetical protein